MLRIFEKDVKPLIGGRAKAMIVATSRIAGLRYFDIIKEKLKERGADYKMLYAFSDFVHPETNVAISEHAINELKDGELIEERFEGDDYRLMVVASSLRPGFDQPLLAGMFLDKPVLDRNVVQTVSRLTAAMRGKRDVVVVDFTNNAAAILKAFAIYRKGTPFEPAEPDPELCTRLIRKSWMQVSSRRLMPPISCVCLRRARCADPVRHQRSRVRFQRSLRHWKIARHSSTCSPGS